MAYDHDVIRFQYGGGFLTVKKDRDMLSMNFPAVKSEKTEITDQLILSLGKQPLKAFKARDLMVLFESEKDILDLKPDLNKMVKIDHLGVIVTAPGENVDFVSRFFAPNAGINEDPVTGSAHCMLIPFWAKRLGKNSLKAQQLSKRGGNLFCENKGDRVEIAGNSVTFMVGDYNI
jgi:predicted PhzF superfamily epimerase YddE/YHI9